MAVTNWVNETLANTALGAPLAGGAGPTLVATITKSATASDAAVVLRFTAAAANLPVTVLVAQAGLTEVATENMVAIGTHTAATAAAQISTRFSVGAAFKGTLPDSWEIYVLNGSTGDAADPLSVDSIQGHYVTT